MSCLWRSFVQFSLAPERAWSKSGTAFGRGRYLIWRIDLTGAPTGWPCCQYRLGIFWGCPVKFLGISFDWIGWSDCGMGGCGTDICGAAVGGELGWDDGWLDFAAIIWRSILMIWSASKCSYAGHWALYTGISSLSLSSFFSKTWIASMRLISHRIISFAILFSASVEWSLNLGMRARSCESHWSSNL